MYRKTINIIKKKKIQVNKHFILTNKQQQPHYMPGKITPFSCQLGAPVHIMTSLPN